MNFTELIEQGRGCAYVDLLEPEKDLYRGAGWFLAAVENGRITEIHSIDEGLTADEMEAIFHDQADLTSQGKRLLAWCEGKPEVWLGMMSCYQFCMPERFGVEKLAKVARLICEQVIG